MEPIVAIEPVAVRLDTAARMLDIGRSTMWRLVRSGVLETVKIGADHRVLVASIRKLVAERKAATLEEKLAGNGCTAKATEASRARAAHARAAKKNRAA